MKDDKTARDQRSRDMNPTYHQFWESRGLEKYDESEGKLGPEIYALPAMQHGMDPYSRPYGCKLTDVELREGCRVAYVTNGKEWLETTMDEVHRLSYNDLGNLNYLYYCVKCGEEVGNNFTWGDLGGGGVSLSDSRQMLLDKLKTIVHAKNRSADG